MSTSHIKGPLLSCIGDMEVPSNSRWPSHLWKIPREIVPLLDQERDPGVVGRPSKYPFYAATHVLNQSSNRKVDKLFPQELACKLTIYGMILILELHCHAKIIHMYVVYSIFYSNLKYLYITINYARSSNDPYGWSDCFESTPERLWRNSWMVYKYWQLLHRVAIAGLKAIHLCCWQGMGFHQGPEGKGFKVQSLLECWVATLLYAAVALAIIKVRRVRGWERKIEDDSSQLGESKQFLLDAGKSVQIL